MGAQPPRALAFSLGFAARREHSSAAIAFSIRAAPGAVHKTGHAPGRRFHTPGSQCAFKRFAGLGHHWHWKNLPHTTIAFAACNNRMTGHTDTFIDRINDSTMHTCRPVGYTMITRAVLITAVSRSVEHGYRAIKLCTRVVFFTCQCMLQPCTRKQAETREISQNLLQSGGILWVAPAKESAKFV